MKHEFHPALDPSSFIMHEDAAHGWLEVPLEALRILGIEKRITHYSYRNGDKVYLEEDFDASLFIRTWNNYHANLGVNTIGVFEDIKSTYCRYSPIRNYCNY